MAYPFCIQAPRSRAAVAGSHPTCTTWHGAGLGNIRHGLCARAGARWVQHHGVYEISARQAQHLARHITGDELNVVDARRGQRL